VAKVQNSEKIIGGYNPLFWDSSNSYKSTKDSFIFSFADRNNLQNANIGYCNNNQNAICCHSNHGPAFGNGQHDLGCNNSNGDWCGYPSSYPKVDDVQNNSYFKVDDYEVIQIV